MGNNKCKPVDFDTVEMLVTNVPIDSLSFDDKRRVVGMLKDTIIAGKDNANGFGSPHYAVYHGHFKRRDRVYHVSCALTSS